METFSHPRLLLEVFEEFPYTPETFAMFNAQEMKSQSKTEQAVKLGKLVDDDTFRRIVLSINSFDTICDFYNNVKASTDAINELRRIGVIAQMQYAEMFDGDAISQQARETIENVLIGKAFQSNPDAVRQITAFRGVRKNIINALSEISDNITFGDYSLEEETAQAIALVYQARQCGYKESDFVSAFARQTALFADDNVQDFNSAQTTVLMLSDLINSQKVTRLKKAFALYNRQAREAASGQLDVFSGEVKSKESILAEVSEVVCNGTEAEVNQAVKEAGTQRRKEAIRIIEQNEYEGDIGSILQTFRSFGIKVETITETEGATVTLYEVAPSVGTRISKIRNLKDEIAIALGVKYVRIIAPMENGIIGIEVPNRQRQIIPIADIMQSKEFLQTDKELPFAIGKTVTDEVFIADIADMPHLLVAGATGQGKSVGLNVLILSLLQKKSPDELKLILIDPKRVEFGPYSRIENSYLACPVITETDEAQSKLEALCELMDERYELLSSLGVRNICEYNALRIAEPMPYIVTVIDEYGDLILTSDTKMERIICRIAQKARAVGIHMIIATQRPDTKIVTGNIKANFPTRIAFRTTTGVDSRVVIDQMGAEKLSGRGDMLFFDGNGTKRMQCAYADVEEVVAACEAISQKYAGYENKPVIKEPEAIEAFQRYEHPLFQWAAWNLGPYGEEAAMLMADEQEVSEDWLGEKMPATWSMIWFAFETLSIIGVIEIIEGSYTDKGGRIARVLIHDKEEIERLLKICEQIRP